jgi:hypothetical protein
MVAEKVLARIRGRGKGTVVFANEMLDLGQRDAVDQTLARLVRKGVLRRVGRGMYYFPRYNKRLKREIGPDPGRIADAIAGRMQWKIQPGGAYAANTLGLTTQVPAASVFLTDGKTHTYVVNNHKIVFKHAAPREMLPYKGISALVFQALRYLGKDIANQPATIARLNRSLSNEQKKQVQKDALKSRGWIRDVLMKLDTEVPA